MVAKLIGAAACAAMIACAAAPATAKSKDDTSASDAAKKAAEEAKLKADKQAKDKAEQEARDKADKDAKDKAEQEAKDKAKQEAKDKADKDIKDKAGKDDGPKTPDFVACTFDQISPAASACQGWFDGNLNGGSDDKNEASAAALNALLGTDAFTGDNLTFLENLGSISGSFIDFKTPLFGETVIAFHVGGANGQDSGIGYTATAFFKFDAGNLVGGLDKIDLNVAGLSNARLYSTGAFQAAVPEPATWAMMILGFGAIGLQLRKRKRALTLAADA